MRVSMRMRHREMSRRKVKRKSNAKRRWRWKRLRWFGLRSRFRSVQSDCCHRSIGFFSRSLNLISFTSSIAVLNFTPSLIFNESIFQLPWCNWIRTFQPVVFPSSRTHFRAVFRIRLYPRSWMRSKSRVETIFILNQMNIGRRSRRRNDCGKRDAPFHGAGRSRR